MSATRINAIRWVPPAEQPAMWPLERWRQFRNLYNRCWTTLTKRHGHGLLANPAWQVMQRVAQDNEASQSSCFWQWERAHFPHGMGRLLLGDWPRTVRLNRHHWKWLKSRQRCGLKEAPTWWQAGVAAARDPDDAIQQLERRIPADPIRQYRGRIEDRLWHFPSGTRSYKIRRWIRRQQASHETRTNPTDQGLDQPAEP